MTTELEVTGEGPGTPSLPGLIDIALDEPEFRDWVDLDPGQERWCHWCVLVIGWPGPTYEQTVRLPEPLGERELYDVGVLPPRRVVP